MRFINISVALFGLIAFGATFPAAANDEIYTAPEPEEVANNIIHVPISCVSNCSKAGRDYDPKVWTVKSIPTHPTSGRRWEGDKLYEEEDMKIEKITFSHIEFYKTVPLFTYAHAWYDLSTNKGHKTIRLILRLGDRDCKLTPDGKTITFTPLEKISSSSSLKTL